MSTDNESTFSLAPMMSAEAGYDGNEMQAPIRISGFVSALLGLVSIVSYLGMAVLIVPLLAIIIGCFALRRYSGPRPVGVTAAYVGIVLAVGFGAFGLGVPLMKSNTLGSQGEFYARQYMKLVAQGDDYYALELKKTFNNRFLSNMPLESYYAGGGGEESLLDLPNDDMPDEMQSDTEAPGSTPQKTLEEFREEDVYRVVQEVGPDGNWELDRPINVYYKYGRDHIDIVFANYDKPRPRLVRFILECTKHPRTGDLEWHVATFMMYRERLVAESIL